MVLVCIGFGHNSTIGRLTFASTVHLRQIKYAFDVYWFQNGVFSMLPYLCFWIMTVVAGYLSDKVQSYGFRTITVRKIWEALGEFYN